MTATLKVLMVYPNAPTELKRVSANLEGMKAAIGGGWLEVFGPNDTTPCQWFGYCDEEGKINNLPVNTYATNFARKVGWNTGDVLCGPVMFVGPTDEDGIDTDVPDELVIAAVRFGLSPL